ncbi:hypothetical protein ACFQ1E_07470 [Sphingomonas canadensis]|uniref:Uncharacterized protein n=1 Tax=Sphingomonas canadensis TaxID=1219257 RepID=A0ABW3H4L1_9SPHN|nr:hypothetical protein [Sphingomonas canadensis]MCW3835874.1 hypothetical protein [Sphingomonas canadensis]
MAEAKTPSIIRRKPAPKDAAGPAIAADAGTDESIAERLERNPESREARLDRALDESMDASDPPASTQPVHQHAPKSSGYDAKAERRRAAMKGRGWLGRAMVRLGFA